MLQACRETAGGEADLGLKKPNTNNELHFLPAIRGLEHCAMLLDEPLVVGETRQPHFWWQILRLRWR